MNCQKGDLAIIVGGTGNVGRIVECVDFCPDHQHQSGIIGCWCVKTKGSPLIAWGGKPAQTELVAFPDAWLRPIRPEADPVTTDCDVGVEA